MTFYLKDPQARIDYAVDWAPGYLEAELVAASDWSVSPDEAGGVAIESSSFDPTRTQAVLAGGLAGKVYRVTNRVTLSDGRVDERALTIRVEDR